MAFDEEHAQALRELDALQGQLDRLTQPCAWFYDEEHDKFDTGCQHEFAFADGGIEDNEFKHCPFCGGPIEERDDE